MSELICPKEVYAAQSAEAKPLVIDVRGPKEYASGHVLGAVNIPLGQLSRKLSKLTQDQLVVTYCNMHHRGSSRGEQAAALLREHGYQARALDGGYPRWKEVGLPVEEAPQA
ncbi:MAG TPA: rhodanese-like domain-containing protein [Ktedonobacterales bacterium]|jgi:rhodanese-related sulfurtransferase